MADIKTVSEPPADLTPLTAQTLWNGVTIPDDKFYLPSPRKPGKRLNTSLLDLTGNDQADFTHTEAQAVEQHNSALDVAAEKKRQSFTPLDKFAGQFLENTMMADAAHAIERGIPETEEGYAQWQDNNSDAILEFAKTDEERWKLFGSVSHQDLINNMRAIERNRENLEPLEGTGGLEAGLYNIMANVADPTGWVAFAGAGKAFEVAGLGAKAFAEAGQVGKAIVASGAEGVTGNVLTTAGIQATGRRTSISDYGMASGMGLLMAAAHAPLLLAGGKVADKTVEELGSAQVRTSAKEQAERVLKAQADLGPDATEAQIMGHVADQEHSEVATFLRATVDGAPESDKLLSSDPEKLLTAPIAQDGTTGGSAVRDKSLDNKVVSLQKRLDAHEEDLKLMQTSTNDLGPGIIKRKQTTITKVKAAIVDAQAKADAGVKQNFDSVAPIENPEYTRLNKAYDLDAIPEDAERGIVAEHIAKAEAVDAANPIDEKGANVMLAKIKLNQEEGSRGLEDTAYTLLTDKSVAARAWGLTMLENSNGAGGRRNTAAITMVTLNRAYDRMMAGYNELADRYRKGAGIGQLTEYATRTSRDEFDRRVFAAIESRGKPMVQPEKNVHVLEAAEKFSAGMDAMRRHRQETGTVGAARLGDAAQSYAYVPHMLRADIINGLSNDQNRAIREILKGQFRERMEFGNEAFLDKLSAQYLDHGKQRANGGFDMSLNVHDVHAGPAVEDAIRAAGANVYNKLEIDQLIGKFARGGAGNTKKRLNLDLDAPIPDADGVVRDMKLRDLFNQDMAGIYKGYSRRVAGEVALAQRGIMGQKGLDLYRQALVRTGASKGAIEAFDQTSSEFMNKPYGSDLKMQFMDNARILNSVVRLGGMGITQLGETANGILALGISRVVQTVPEMGSLLSDIRNLRAGKSTNDALLRDFDDLLGGVGVDDYHLTGALNRPHTDLPIVGKESVGMVTRGIREAGHIAQTLSGNRIITSIQTRAMAKGILRKAVDFARTGAEDTALRDMGISAELQAKIKAGIDKNGSKFVQYRNGKLVGMNLAESGLTPAEINIFGQNVMRGTGQIIQKTYIGETGKWAHDGVLKMLFQFRTFGLTSIDKQWGRNVLNHGGLTAAMYLAGAMSVALPLHVARTYLASLGLPEEKRKKLLDQRLSIPGALRATMNYASNSGILGDTLDVATGAVGAIGGPVGQTFRDFSGQGNGRGTGGQNLIGDVLFPAVGILNDTWGGLHDMAHGSPHRLLHAVPGASLPYAQPFVNAMETAIKPEAN